VTHYQHLAPPFRRVNWKTLAVVAVLAAGPLQAADESDNSSGEEPGRGLEIAREQDRRGSGFQDLRADLRMVLISKRGDTSERQLGKRVLEGTATMRATRA
jgi:hypothetical protein